MADRFAGKGGSDANSGATWALRKLTIGSLVSIVAIAAGDRLLVGPGVYRETVTLNDSGAHVIGTVDDASTVTVTNESRIVTGAGTNFAAAAAGQQFFIGNFASGADGQTYGTTAFTSAGGNFQTNMEGYMIEIMTLDPYLIDTVGGAGAITLSDPNVLGNPGAAGPGLDYYVVSGEGPYEIESIDSATQITLVKPWSGPTLTGLSYEIYNPIHLIGDVTGVETDDVGGVVRITGSDDDEALNRGAGIVGDTDHYWFIRGFQIDSLVSIGVYGDTCNYWTIEDCVFFGCDGYGVNLIDSTHTTVRRCIVLGTLSGTGVYLFANPAIENNQSLLENLYTDCGGSLATVGRVGGVTIKNCTMGFAQTEGIWVNNLNSQIPGSGVLVHDCLLHNQSSTLGAFAALNASVLGEIISQYNNFWNNATDVTLVTITAQDTTYPFLPMLPLLTGRARNPTTLFAPSQWDLTRYAGGLYPSNMDLYGVHNEVAQTRRSWGCTHSYATVRSTDQVQGTFTGSMYLEDAGEQQFVFPVRANWDYTVTVWVYIEANYAGNGPEMIVKQPGEVSVVATSTIAIGSWEQLSVEFTTGPEMDWINVGLRSNNTSGLANRGTYWQDLAVN